MTTDAPNDAARPGTDGMYVLANDRVYHWVIAFFESLREHDPDLRVVMIPFDQQMEKVAELRDRYRFELFDDPALAELDEIGRRFFPAKAIPRHTFRKFAVFWGPLERFIFSDVDILYLDDAREFLDAHARSGLDLLYTDADIRQVYERPDVVRRMVETYGAQGFNTGFWAARRGLFSLESVRRLADEAGPLAAGFNQGTYEQPFLNFCVDVARLRYDHFTKYLPDLTSHTMAAERLDVRPTADGSWRVTDAASPEHGKRMKFLHWAGTAANEVMPYRSLYWRYRLAGEAPTTRTWMRVISAPRALYWNTIRWARTTTILSRTYKRLLPKRIQWFISGLLYRK